ncbi:MAG: proline--tRNA ligase [Mycoplasmatales bacterium]
MKQSMMFIPTVKEVPNNAAIASHKLLLKAGYVTQHASGLYSYLPLAVMCLENIQTIIDQEIKKTNANKVSLPFLQPENLWLESGRWQTYGPELFRIGDRHENMYALAPTHEEIATDVVRNHLKSYKKYPLNIYQINTKMRDEIRPRFGLIRAREFIMMDGYSFHATDECLNQTYDAYYNAYARIFERLGMKFKFVNADNGAMGGSKSHEIMALAECGEDTICYEENSETAYNLEAAPVCTKYEQVEAEMEEILEVETPNITTIQDLVNFFDGSGEVDFLKAVCYDVDGKLVIGFTLGNRQIEETKLLRFIGGETIETAEAQLLVANKLIAGFIGPIGLNDVTMVFDNEIKYVRNLITGANKLDMHLKNINLERDLPEAVYADIRQVEAGDLIRVNGEPVKLTKGIEIGHIFALGKKYTESMKMTFQDIDQKNQVPTMGCYGIGVSRILSALIEQNHDDKGLIIPEVIAPYKIHLIPLDYGKDEAQTNFTDELYTSLVNNGFTVLLDDRNERPGVKFNDADLIGLPYQVIVGRSFKEGKVEFKNRKTYEKTELTINELEKLLKENNV